MEDMDGQAAGQLKVFADLLPEQWELVVPLLTRIRVIEGEMLIRQGNRPDCLFVVLKGHFMIHRNEGRCITVNKKGSVLGWFSAFSPDRYTANVTALTDGWVLSVDAGTLRDQIAADPRLEETLLKRIRENISERHSMGAGGAAK
ncbi:MAG: Crp/Fnr family transcriptional regulator [Desulfobacterales bacterium]|nr:Crp/Fnr family transcriptional regulator [Desulfobacterales bacterium]